MNNSKHIAFGILAAATLLLVSCGGGKPNYKVSLKNETDSVSYYIGYNFGISVAGSEIEDFNVTAMAKGVMEAVNHGKKVDEQKAQELQAYLQKYFTNLQVRLTEKALKEGQDFLEANKKKQGVVTLPSGLQYKIIKEGTGAKPTKEDEVDVVYHGTLIDGTVFDSSKERGDTTTLGVGQVVPGFSEALTLMNEGSVWEVYIPAELGYGEHPNPRSGIKPNSALVFEIDMVKIKK